jgi:hypothetical protein
MRNFTFIVLLLIPLFLSSCLKDDNESNHELSAIYHALTDIYTTSDELASISYATDSASTKIQVAGTVFLSDFRKTKIFNTTSGAVEAKDSVNLVVVFSAPASKDTLYIPCLINSLQYYKQGYDEYSGVWIQLFDGINYIDLTCYNKNGIYYKSLEGKGGLSLSIIVKNYEAQ